MRWRLRLRCKMRFATDIVGAVYPALVQFESERAVRADPANTDAWTAALRGWWHLNLETAQGNRTAREWFATAIDSDPRWGWPHAADSLSHHRDLLSGFATAPRESVGALIKSAQTAVELDPQDGFAHHALGHAYSMMGQVDNSLAALARGVELLPSDPMANGCYGMQLAASNRPAEAIAAVEKAIALSPKDPWMHRFALVRARASFAAEDYEGTKQWALRSYQLRPSPWAVFHAAAASAYLGELDEARQRIAESSLPLPSLENLRTSLARSTDAAYIERLAAGLTLAGYQ